MTKISSIAEIVRTHAANRGSDPALTFEGRDISWAELDERTSRVARALLEAGVEPQEHVAFLDKNTPEYFEVVFGSAKVNAINVAVNWRLAPPEMAYMVNDAQAKVLVVGQEFVPQLEEFRGELTTVKEIVITGEQYDGWVGAQAADDPRVPSGPSDVCMQLYTSGTTGRPKGAMLTNDNLFGVFEDAAGKEWFFDESTVNLVVMPLFHIAGCGWALAGMYFGGRSILHRDVNPPAILEAIPEFGVTNALFVPALLQFLLMTPGVDDNDYSSLRVIVYGASPISEDVLIRSIQTFKCNFVQAYGMTETTGAITILRPQDHDPGGPRANLLRSCGVPFPWCEVKIVDPATGEAKPTGEVGEIWSQTRQNMKGYWNMPEETAATIDADGWLHTGDAAFSDEDGYIYIYDRVKDMIVSGGENIYPAEVENALMGHPAIADLAVIGVPDQKWGETVKALVVKSADVTAEDIIEFARQKIARYKCPTSVDFIDAVPRNPSGKILKKVLREPYWKGEERRVH